MMDNLLHAAQASIDAKLGRCAECIRLSVILTIASLTVVALLVGAGSQRAFVLTAAVPAFLFTLLSTAHGVAYFVREPAAGSCTPCAAKAKARRRAARYRRLRRLLLFQAAPAPSKARRRCGTCGKRRTTEELVQAADGLPRADQGLRGIVEASAEFRLVEPRLASREPVDDWFAEGRHHFVYPLKSNVDGDGATALFVARWQDYGLHSAVTIHPQDAGEPRVVDLRA